MQYFFPPQEATNSHILVHERGVELQHLDFTSLMFL